MACAGLLVAAPLALFLAGGGDAVGISRDPEGVFTGDPNTGVGGGPGPSAPGVATESSQSPAADLPPVDPAADVSDVRSGGGTAAGDAADGVAVTGGGTGVAAGTGTGVAAGTGTGTGAGAVAGTAPVAGAQPAPAGGSTPRGTPSGGGTSPSTSPGGTPPGGTSPGGTSAGGTPPGGTQPGGGTSPATGGSQPQQPPAQPSPCLCETVTDVVDGVTDPVTDVVGGLLGE